MESLIAKIAAKHQATSPSELQRSTALAQPSPPEQAPAKSSPAPHLLVGYQRQWLQDQSRLKLMVKARRIGGSFIAGLEAAMGAAGIVVGEDGGWTYSPETGVDQRIVSASASQGIELLEEVARHLEVLQLVVGQPLMEEPTRTRIKLLNGTKCVALAANPRTVRGGKGDLILDEFGAMPASQEIWAAAKSITDPTLGHPQGYKLRVIGTPLGDDNWFYRLAKTDQGQNFSRYTIDVYRAIADGFPANAAKLREEIGDSDLFGQEYECAFLGANTRYISSELYDACEYSSEERPTGRGTWYAGMDIARSPSGDLSVIQQLARVAKVLWDEGHESRRGVRWSDQEEWVAGTLNDCQRIAIDGTGIGSQFGERLQDKFGGRVEVVEFSTASKEMLATGLRLGMEQRQLRLRQGDVALRRAVLSLRREITSQGNIRYDAPRTKQGHADEAWALALAVHAAGRVSSVVGVGESCGTGYSEAEALGDL